MRYGISFLFQIFTIFKERHLGTGRVRTGVQQQCSVWAAVCTPPTLHCTVLHPTALHCVLYCTVAMYPEEITSPQVQVYRNGKLDAGHKRMMPQLQSTVMSQGNNLGHNEAVVALNLPLHSENRPYIIGDNITTVSSCHQWVTFEWFIRAFFSILILMDILFVPL